MGSEDAACVGSRVSIPVPAQNNYMQRARFAFR